MPVTALGCQTTNSFWASSPAAEKKAGQSRPGARPMKSWRVQWLLPFRTSSESARLTCASAMRCSSSKIRAAFASASAMPASFRTAAMCA